FFYLYLRPLNLHSFPTRRSSDLSRAEAKPAVSYSDLQRELNEAHDQQTAIAVRSGWRARAAQQSCDLWRLQTVTDRPLPNSNQPSHSNTGQMFPQTGAKPEFASAPMTPVND